MNHLALDALFALLVLVSSVLWRRYKHHRARGGLPLPPGPPGLPVIGNLLDIPASYEWIAYRDWSIKHG